MALPIKTSPAVPKVRRVRVYPRLSAPLRKRLAEYCAAKGLAERDAIEAAILQYLDGTSDGAKVLARLDRIDEALDVERQRQELQQGEAHRDLEILSEAFGRFLHLWFVVHAETFAKSIDGAPSTPGELYRRFATRLADDFLRGHRFVHDLPKVANARSSRSP
ncbi:MAG TPA: hypothetical protein VEK07_11855 [Polyangiaceae bacterium]|nr:hypothetical protein [Polyangiaceae bacterium]